MQIIAKKREEFGKKNKALRKTGVLPGAVMEKGNASIPVEMNFIEFSKVYSQAGETSLIDLSIGTSSSSVLVSEVQLHPVSLKPIHVSFRKVNLKEKITAQIPVEIINEEENQLVKSKEALVLKLLDEIEVEALPTDLPHEFVIDALKFENIGDEVTVGDLNYDKSKVKVLNHGDDDPVAKLDRVEEMEEEVTVTEEEALAKVTATEELSDEEKAKRASEKDEKSDKDKKDKK